MGRERARAGYGVLPYLASKLAAELPVGALFPALFGCLVYPATGLNPSPKRFASFLGLLTLEAMSAQVSDWGPGCVWCGKGLLVCVMGGSTYGLPLSQQHKLCLHYVPALAVAVCCAGPGAGCGRRRPLHRGSPGHRPRSHPGKWPTVSTRRAAAANSGQQPAESSQQPDSQ